MARYSDDFGERVSELLRRKALSPYDVQRASDGAISHQTVRNMMKGILPSPNLVVEFARAVDEDPNTLLGLTDWHLSYSGPAFWHRTEGGGGSVTCGRTSGALAAA